MTPTEREARELLQRISNGTGLITSEKYVTLASAVLARAEALNAPVQSTTTEKE